MKKLAFFTVLLLSTAAVINAQITEFPKLDGPYLGQKPPGMAPEIFAPGIVSSMEATEYAVAFTPDGKQLYFNRNGVGVMVCTWNDTGWTKPIKAPFLEKFKGVVLFFQKQADNPGVVYGHVFIRV